MTKFVSASVLCGLLLVAGSGQALAIDATTRPMKIRNEAIREAQKDFREDKEARKASISGARQTFRTERARIHGERLARHFTFYEQRLNNIATRIATRIEKERADGKDVSSAQSSLESARTAISTAVTEGKKAVALFSAISTTTWDAQQPEIKAAIEQAQKARQSFAQSHKLLADAIKALATN